MKKSIFVLLLIAVVACTNRKYEIEPTTVCDVSDIKYERDIVPILETYCNLDGCHSNNPGYGANYSFTDYEGIKEAIGSVQDRVNRNAGDPLLMPQNSSPLDACSLSKLNSWITNGAPNN